MDNFELRDRRGGFLWISNRFFDAFIGVLQPSSWLVYCSLARLAHNDTQECYPSYETISTMTGLARSTVAECLIELKETGAISWKKSGRHNVYSLLDCNSPKNGRVRKTDTTSPIYDENQSAPSDSNKTKNKTKEQDLVLSPSERKEPTRFTQFKELVFRFYVWKWGREPAWDGAEQNQLSRLLKADPKLEINTFALWLKNYGASKDISPGERPCMFLPRISKYSVVALNQYGRDENVGQESLAERNANAFASVFGVHFAQDSAPVLEGDESAGHQSVARISQRPHVAGD